MIGWKNLSGAETRDEIGAGRSVFGVDGIVPEVKQARNKAGRAPATVKRTTPDTSRKLSHLNSCSTVWLTVT